MKIMHESWTWSPRRVYVCGWKIKNQLPLPFPSASKYYLHCVCTRCYGPLASRIKLVAGTSSLVVYDNITAMNITSYSKVAYRNSCTTDRT